MAENIENSNNNQNKKQNAKKIAFTGALTALALIMFLVESLFPPLFVPGAKLGLGNIFVLIALVFLGFKSALVVVLVKCVAAGIFGGVSAILYSIPAGVVSLVISAIMLYGIKKISLVAVGAASAVLHNLVQNLVFALIMKTPSVLAYAPYLALCGILAGVVTGLATYFIVKATTPYIMKKINIMNI